MTKEAKRATVKVATYAATLIGVIAYFDWRHAVYVVVSVAVIAAAAVIADRIGDWLVP